MLKVEIVHSDIMLVLNTLVLSTTIANILVRKHGLNIGTNEILRDGFLYIQGQISNEDSFMAPFVLDQVVSGANVGSVIPEVVKDSELT